MTPNIYAPYADVIRNIVKTGARRGELKKSFSATNLSTKSPLMEALEPFSGFADRSVFNKLSALNSQVAAPNYGNSTQAPGNHPDFKHLRDSGLSMEKHYITTMFIDIKNSTRMFAVYEPEVVAAITIAVQHAAIHTCWYFGGYVHRLHGDGLMIYFGGKDVPKETSVQQALHASSFFSYFIKYDLENILGEMKLERSLYTRIGIDMGEKEDVVWHVAGIGLCSEVTTCSLHTSLAAKMQSNAESNGIVVGDNVKKLALNEAPYFSIIKDDNGKEDRYIFTIPAESFYYTQWKFNWYQFLKAHPDVEVDQQGNLRYKPLQQQPRPSGPQTAHLLPRVEGYKPYYRG